MNTRVHQSDSSRESERLPADMMGYLAFNWIHCLVLGMIGLWIPFKPSQPMGFYQVFLVVLSVSTAAFAAGRRPVRQGGPAFIAFFCLTAGLTLSALYTEFPELSAEYFPDLKYIYILAFLGCIGFIAWSWVRGWTVRRTGWILSQIAGCLLFTQPLDKFDYAMVFPVLFLLVTLTADPDSSELLLPVRGWTRHIVTTITLCVFLIFIRAAAGWQFGDSIFIIHTCLAVYFLLLFLVTLRLAQESPADRYWDAAILNMLIIAVLAVLSVWRWMWLTELHGVNQLYRFKLWVAVNHPNATAAYLGASLPFLVFNPFRIRFMNWLRSITGSLGILMIISTYSRGAWIAFASGVAVLFIWEITCRRNRLSAILNHRVMVPMAILSVAVVGIVFSVSGYRIQNMEALENRRALWRLCLQGIQEEPLYGYGPASHALSKSYMPSPFDQHSGFLKEWVAWDGLGRHFHSITFETLWVSGILGSTLLAVILGMIIIHIVRHGQSMSHFQRFATAGLVVLLVTGIMDFVFYYPALAGLLAVLLGFVLGPPRPAAFIRAVSNAPPANRHVLVGFLAAVLILIEITVVIRPNLGAHWKRRGMRKLAAGDIWAAAAFEKAERYLPGDMEIQDKLLHASARQSDPDQARMMIQRLAGESSMTIQYKIMAAWFIPDPAERAAEMEKIVAMDPSGFGPFDHQIDYAFALFLNDQQDPGSDVLQTVILRDPDIIQTFNRFFSRIPAGYLVHTSQLSDFLGDRYRLPLFNDLRSREFVLPITTVMTDLEQTLITGDDATPEIRTQRIHFARLNLQLRNFRSTIRHLNMWNITLEELVDRGQEVTTFTDDNPEFVLIRAVNMFRSGQITAAEEAYLSLLLAGYDDARLRIGLGRIKMIRHQWTEARFEFEQALRLAPEFAEAHTNLGIIAFHLNEFPSSEYHLTRALKLNPVSGRSMLYMSYWMVLKDRLGEGKRLALQAAELLPHENAAQALKVILEEMTAQGYQSGTPGPLSISVDNLVILPQQVQDYLADRYVIR